MPRKEFHTRRQWHNVSVWAISSLLFVLFALVIAARSGDWPILYWVAGPVLLGLVITYLHDRGVDAVYTVEQGRLTLWNRKDRMVLSREEIRDASLVDRTAARTYIRQKVDDLVANGTGEADVRARMGTFTRFCTVDIGLRSYTFGIGRRLVDTMPNAKHDLVLLRLRDGSDVLLSPLYNQGLMDAISTLLRA
jgi:hypothetical protein